MKENLIALKCKTILVTGGCGFIGSHIVDGLLRKNCKVIIIDRHREVFRKANGDVTYHMGDLSDPDLLATALHGVDSVIHLASSTVPSTSNINIESDIFQNLTLTIRLLEAMKLQGVSNIVFMSSGGTVYGPSGVNLINESHPKQPISSYGIVKLTIENYLHLYKHNYGLRYCILRASNPYGPRQGNFGIQGVIATCLRNTLDGNRMEIWGDGSIVRDFIYVDDLADLCVRAVFSSQSGVFNAGSGLGVSINEVVKIIGNITNNQAMPIYKPSRNFDVQKVVLDNSLAKVTFDWAPKTDLSDGIELTWRWMSEGALNSTSQLIDRA